MSDVKKYLAAALEWKYGPVADTAGEKITAWRHGTLPKPSDLDKLVVEYVADELPHVRAAREFDRDHLVEILAVEAHRKGRVVLPEQQIMAINARRRGRGEGPF